MRRFQSMSQIADYLSDKARISKTYGKYMASYVSAFTMIMKTCKGRDKICSMIQYMADIQYYCIKYSEFPLIRQKFARNQIIGAIVAERTKNSMKNSRKIFKFLKFIDHIASIVKTVDSKKSVYLKVVSILQSLMAFFSNIFDNIIWGINTKVLDDFFSDRSRKKLKANKYFFSLCKIIFKMLSNNYKHHHRIKSMKQIIYQLRQHRQTQISIRSNSYELCKQYLKHRHQVRIQQLDGAIMVFRIIMLVRKLRLPGYTYVTKILYSFCGLVTTILNITKMVIDQPILVQLQEKDKTMKTTKSSNRFEQLKDARRIKVSRSGTINFFESRKEQSEHQKI